MSKEKEITFKIVKEIGVLSTNDKGWSLELNVVTWNGGKPKYDIRAWNEDHSKMGKGIRMTQEELNELVNLVNHTENVWED